MTLIRKPREETPPPPIKEWVVEVSAYGVVTVDESRNLKIKDHAAAEVFWCLSYEEADELETALREAREQCERERGASR